MVDPNYDPNAEWLKRQHPAQTDWRDSRAVVYPAGLAVLGGAGYGGTRLVKNLIGRARGKPAEPGFLSRGIKALRGRNLSPTPSTSADMIDALLGKGPQYRLPSGIAGELGPAGSTGQGMAGRVYIPDAVTARRGFYNTVSGEAPYTVTGFSPTGVPIGRNIGGGTRFLRAGETLADPNVSVIENAARRVGRGVTNVGQLEELAGGPASQGARLGGVKGGLLGVAAGVGASIIDNTDFMRSIGGRPSQKQAAGDDMVSAMIQSRAEKNDRSNSIWSDIGQTFGGMRPGQEISSADMEAAEQLYNEGLIKFKPGGATGKDSKVSDVGSRGGNFKVTGKNADRYYTERGVAPGADLSFGEVAKTFGDFELTDKGRALAGRPAKTGSPEQSMADSLAGLRQGLADEASYKGVHPDEVLSQYDSLLDSLVTDKDNGYLDKDGVLKPSKVKQLKKDAADLYTVTRDNFRADYYANQQERMLADAMPGQILAAYGEFFEPYAQQYMAAGQQKAAAQRITASKYPVGSPIYEGYMAQADAEEMKGLEAANHMMWSKGLLPWMGASTNASNELAKQIGAYIQAQKGGGSSNDIASVNGEGDKYSGQQDLVDQFMSIFDQNIMPRLSAGGLDSGSLSDFEYNSLYGMNG